MHPLLNKINNLYGLTVASAEKVTIGFLSENHILSDSAKKYFLKKYRFDDPNRIAEIHSVKKYFSAGGIPVILPLPLLDGKTFFEHDGGYYTVFPFVDGRHIERSKLSEAAIVSLGKMLGRIHLLGKQAKLPISNEFKIDTDENTFKKIDEILGKIVEIKNPTEVDKVALDNVMMKKRLLLQNKVNLENSGLVSDHLIHGDYLDHNVFFDENDDVKWVFDFEKTSYSPRTYELFRSMMYCILSADAQKGDLENARKYVSAYSSVYPISKEEIKKGLELYFSKSIHSFWVETEHYLKGNTRVDHFLFDENKRLKYLSENLEEVIRKVGVGECEI